MELSEKLKAIRSNLKLTLEAASERSRIGVSTLSDFENGKREPRLGQLKQLAEAYRCSLSHLLDEEPQQAECVLWRHRPESPNAEDLQAKLVDLAEKYHTLEALCDEHAATDLPAVSESADQFTYSVAGRLAREIRGLLGLGDRPGQTLLRVVEEVCKIKVFYLDFEPTGTAACTVSERFGAAVLLNSKNVPWRRNFDLAHEFFHLLTWKVFRHDKCGPVDVPSEQEEKFATCFARNLLMPEEVFRGAVESQRSKGKLGFDGLFVVAREFDVSVEAVLRQIGFVFNRPQEETQELVGRLRERINTWETRGRDVPPSRPLRFHALARQALQRGLLSTGSYADFVGISRREAMRIVEQDAAEDVEVEIADP